MAVPVVFIGSNLRMSRKQLDIVTAMTYRAVLRGYLLEEALAWLLRNSGYELLTDKDQDPEALGWDRGALVVHGRGADHQVDVLGNFALTPAFSLPIRMFLEAKYYSTPCRLPVVRNAHGVIYDVNENFVHPAGSRPRRRYQYVYALFSASGFTRPAQDYGLAQQISLVDLSSVSFGWLKEPIAEAAAQLYVLRNQHRISRFPVSWMRHVVRTRLGTPSAAETFAETDDGLVERFATNAPRFRAAAAGVLDTFAASLRVREKTELLLGFPAAPFILPLAVGDADRFLSFAELRPVHDVRLRRSGTGEDAEWGVTPCDDPNAYSLTFSLPDRVESWINENEDRQAKRTHQVKGDFLTAITIYRRASNGMRVYQLCYVPGELRRPGV